MNRRTRFETILLVVVTLDTILGLSLTMATGVTFTGYKPLVVAILTIPLCLGLATSWYMTKRISRGLLLGAIFYGVQAFSGDYDGHFQGLSWGLAANLRFWTSPDLKLSLNIWATTLCALFLIALVRRRDNESLA